MVTKTNLAFLKDPRGSTDFFKAIEEAQSQEQQRRGGDDTRGNDAVYNEKVLTVAQACWRLRSFTEREQKHCSAKVIKYKHKLAAFRTKIHEKSRQFKHQSEILSGIENEVNQMQEVYDKNVDQLLSGQKEVTYQLEAVTREQNRHRYLVSCTRELSAKVDKIRQKKLEWSSDVSRARKRLKKI